MPAYAATMGLTCTKCAILHTIAPVGAHRPATKLGITCKQCWLHCAVGALRVSAVAPGAAAMPGNASRVQRTRRSWHFIAFTARYTVRQVIANDLHCIEFELLDAYACNAGERSRRQEHQLVTRDGALDGDTSSIESPHGLSQTHLRMSCMHTPVHSCVFPPHRHAPHNCHIIAHVAHIHTRYGQSTLWATRVAGSARCGQRALQATRVAGNA